jgi:hypothetical protein
MIDTESIRAEIPDQVLVIVREQFSGYGIQCPEDAVTVAGLLYSLIQQSEDEVDDFTASGEFKLAEEAATRVTGFDNAYKAFFDAWT